MFGLPEKSISLDPPDLHIVVVRLDKLSRLTISADCTEVSLTCRSSVAFDPRMFRWVFFSADEKLNDKRDAFYM